MSKLFDFHWQWSNEGVLDAAAVGRVVRTCVQQLVKKGYDRAEILFMIQAEVADELLKTTDAKREALFVLPEKSPEQKDVHTEHCCIAHGCKYCDDDCPVWLGYKQQSYLCESCTCWDDPDADHHKGIPPVTKETITERRNSLKANVITDDLDSVEMLLWI